MKLMNFDSFCKRYPRVVSSASHLRDGCVVKSLNFNSIPVASQKLRRGGQNFFALVYFHTLKMSLYWAISKKIFL